MNTEEKIKKIVKELYEWQQVFLDDYTRGEWREPKKVQTILRACAKDILKTINEY